MKFMRMVLSHSFFRTIARLIAAVPLGYFLIADMVAVLGAVIALAGMSRSEAVVLAAMCGFILYLVWLIWAFSERCLLRLYVVVLAGLSLSFLLLHFLFPSGV
jgi:hypothetical protein